jgi:ribosomal protein L7/L12
MNLVLLLGALLILGLLVVSGVLITVFVLNRNGTPAAPYVADLEQDARALVQGGRQIEAIRLVRKHTGVGLVEARDYVRALEQSAPPTHLSHGAPPPAVDPELERQVRDLINDKQKIAAVKLVREQTGWGLREAKDYVDAVERTNDR